MIGLGPRRSTHTWRPYLGGRWDRDDPGHHPEIPWYHAAIHPDDKNALNKLFRLEEDLIFYIWIELSRQFLFISIQYTFVPVYNHNAFNLSWFQTGSVWVTTLPPALNTLSLFVLEAGIARYFLASLASNGRESSWTNLFYSEWSTGCRDLHELHEKFNSAVCMKKLLYQSQSQS